MDAKGEGFGPLLHRELGSIKVPPKPAILTRIEQEMRNGEANYVVLEKIISSDVSIAASLLKLANSAYFGRREEARSVKEALEILGLNHVAAALAALALRRTFAHVPHLTRFWDASARVASLSGWLSTQLSFSECRPIPAEVYTFGLFRDSGIAVLMSFYADYVDVLRVANNDSQRPFTSIETDLMGADHTLVGTMLATEWTLPEEFRYGIEHHHDEAAIRGTASDLDRPLARHFMALAQTAEWILQQLTGLNKTCEWVKLGGACRDVLGLGEDDVSRLAQLAREAGLHNARAD